MNGHYYRSGLGGKSSCSLFPSFADPSFVQANRRSEEGLATDSAPSSSPSASTRRCCLGTPFTGCPVATTTSHQPRLPLPWGMTKTGFRSAAAFDRVDTSGTEPGSVSQTMVPSLVTRMGHRRVSPQSFVFCDNEGYDYR